MTGSIKMLLLLSTVISLMGHIIATTTLAPMTDDEVLDHLEKYGYAGESSPIRRVAALLPSNPSRAMEVGLMLYQDRYGLEVTGEMNDETLALMRTDRCGMPDMTERDRDHNINLNVVLGNDRMRRKKRYVASGGQWCKEELTYRVMEYSVDVSHSVVDYEMERALQLWADVTPLSFRRVTSGSADFLIYFASGYHLNDGNPFDGEGGTLAHAYYPDTGSEFEGDVHFDEDETWRSESYDGTDLFQVALHEFGHSLGLAHSTTYGAVMYPYYYGYIPNLELHYDDIDGIQSIYGDSSESLDCDDDNGSKGLAGSYVMYAAVAAAILQYFMAHF